MGKAYKHKAFASNKVDNNMWWFYNTYNIGFDMVR